MKVQKFKRGQIWWYKTGDTVFETASGKTRLVLIISNDLINQNLNSMIGIPCTSQLKESFNTHLTIDLNGTESTLLAENIMLLNKNKMGGYIGTCDGDLMSKVNNCIKAAVGLEINCQEIKVKTREPKAKPMTFEELANLSHIPKNEEVSNITTEPVFADDTPMEEKLSTRKAYKGVGRKGYQKYTREQMQEFIDDCENHTIAFVTKKYNCSSEKATSNKLYRFRKFLKENP